MTRFSHFVVILLAVVATGRAEVKRADADKATAFKKKFLQFSSHCASAHDTSLVDVMPLLAANASDTSKGMCYMLCMLDKYQLINKKGHYMKGNFRTFLDSIPESRFKKSLESTMGKCIQEDAQELCQKAYKFTKCFYNSAVTKNQPEEG